MMLQEIKFDVKKIKQDINNLSNFIKSLKQQIRQPKVNITADQSRMLSSAKYEVTKLCTLQAARRNKVHFAGKDLATNKDMKDYQDVFLNVFLDKYLAKYTLSTPGPVA